jgi:hypothetical protein
LQLHYKKNIEGFIDDNERGDEIYSMWDTLDQETFEETGNDLLEKINKFLGLLAFEIWYRLFITNEMKNTVRLD